MSREDTVPGEKQLGDWRRGSNKVIIDLRLEPATILPVAGKSLLGLLRGADFF